MSRQFVISKCALIVVLSLVCSSCALFGPSSDQMFGLDNYLAKDTVFYIETTNTPSFREAWLNTPSGEAWQDPGVAYWRESNLTPALRGLTDQMHLPNVLDALEHVEGATALAIMIPEGASEQPPQLQMVALMDFGVNASAARASLNFEPGQSIAPPKSLAKHIDSIELHGSPWFDWQPCSTWVGDNWVFATSLRTLQTLLERRFRVGERLEEDRRFSQSPLGRTLRAETAEAHLRWGLNIAAIHGTYVPALFTTLRAVGLPEQAARLKTLFNIVGVGGVESLTTGIRIRNASFYTRTALKVRGETGFILPLRGGDPFRTPVWFESDTEEFSVIRSRKPAAVYAEIKQAMRQLAPDLESLLSLFEGGVETRTGETPETLLKALGTEIAFAAPSQKPDGFLLAWEISNPPLIRSALRTLAENRGEARNHTSYRGYPYDSWQAIGLPVRLQTAILGDFLVVTNSEEWLRGFVDRQHTLATADEETIAALRAGGLSERIDSLLGPARRGSRIAEMGSTYPGKMLSELEGAMPLAIPLINLQMRMQGLPTIPGWVRGCIPPLRPWGERVGETLVRTVVQDDVFITESYGGFDPLVSPLLAAGTCAAYQILKPRTETQP